MKENELIELAVKARKNSYSPYSGFAVGASLLCDDGSVFLGANIENGAYSATVCAERVALFKAVSEGKRKFSAIAIVGGRDSLDFCPPCGVCRQTLSEFCDGEFKIILAKDEQNYKVYTLKELLPSSFCLSK